MFSKSENTFSLTAIKFSPVGISYWCNTSFDAESRAEYDPRGYISIGAIFEILWKNIFLNILVIQIFRQPYFDRNQIFVCRYFLLV